VPEHDQHRSIRPLLERTLDHALDYVDALDTRPVRADASVADLRETLLVPLPDDPVDPATVIDDLVRAAGPGLVQSSGGRFFAWVIGGTLPAALAADWLASAWDQNGAILATSPAAAIVEEAAGAWLKELLVLPAAASFAFVTGSQMAHVTALAAARHRLLADRGWDVERRGLAGAPAMRVLVGGLRHETVVRAVRMLGIGSDAIRTVPTDGAGRLVVDALAAALDDDAEAPTIVCLQAGELSTGAYDRFAEACALARARGAWAHVDGAFGLWAAASPSRRRLLAGSELAHSWTTDGHKWLNVPYDCGYVFVADVEAHRAAMTITGSYFTHDALGRDEMEWNPEWSRRARGFATYAALRSLGRSGVAALVDRACEQASRLVAAIGDLDGAEVVSEPVINQGLVRFLAADGDHDRRTDEVVARIVADGEAYFAATTFGGRRCMRVSVSSWRTTDGDIERTLGAVRAALAARPA
jgi:glutamate/tyrosine decarboxylase-like PLP-dependent enzyme